LLKRKYISCPVRRRKHIGKLGNYENIRKDRTPYCYYLLLLTVSVSVPNNVAIRQFRLLWMASSTVREEIRANRNE
jgi:hypothetical protein